MKRIFLHIGQPKCGTTAIQRAFAEHSDSAENRTVYYPRKGRYVRKLVAHHNLAYELYAPKSFLPARGSWADLEEEVRSTGADNILLSSEAFRRFLANTVAAKFRKHFADYDCKVILYLRPQWDYIESGYNQLLRFGRHSGTISEFYKEQGAKITEYKGIVTAWGKAIGHENIICLPFDKEAKTIGIVSHMLKYALKLDVEMPDSDIVNKRFGLKALSAIRYCSEKYIRETGEMALPVRYIVMISDLFRHYPGEVNDFTFMKPELRRKIYQDSLETNQWLAVRYRGFATSEFLSCSPSGKDNTVAELPTLTKEEREICDSLVRAAARGRLVLRYSNGQRIAQKWWEGRPSILNLRSWKPDRRAFRPGERPG